MNDLVSYLLAQARYRPVATAKFAAGEIWRRGRLRLLDSLESDLPVFSTYLLRSRFLPFYPARALEAAEFGSHFLGAADAGWAIAVPRLAAHAVFHDGFCRAVGAVAGGKAETGGVARGRRPVNWSTSIWPASIGSRRPTRRVR